MTGPSYHGRTHLPGGTDPVGPVYEIKVFGDTQGVTTGDGKFVLAMPRAARLGSAHAFVTTVSSSGAPTVQIRNVTQAQDMLTTKVTIDASETTSFTAATPPVVNATNALVDLGDLIAIDVDVAGTGAKGLGVILTFV